MSNSVIEIKLAFKKPEYESILKTALQPRLTDSPRTRALLYLAMNGYVDPRLHASLESSAVLTLRGGILKAIKDRLTMAYIKVMIRLETLLGIEHD